MNLNDKTRQELLLLAKDLNISGRHKMNKKALIDVIEKLSAPSADADSVESSPMPVQEKPAEKKVIKRDFAPIADYYDQDSIFILPVDARNSYVCWEVSKHTQDITRSKFGLSGFNCVIKIISEENGEIAMQTASSIGSCYFKIYAPFERVWAEIGIFDKDGNYHVILSSNKMVMPSDQVSSKVDSQWLNLAQDWKNIFDMSGVESATEQESSITKQIINKVREFIASSGGAK